MYNFLMPDKFVKSVYDITPELLQSLGKKGIITDLDNTLVEWNRPDATEELAAWFLSMQQAGIHVVIASNNNEERVQKFAAPLNIPYVHRAKKPLGSGFAKALTLLNVKQNEAVMIGDQLLTDVMGAKRLNLYTFLVRPVAQSDGFVTRFNRFVERRVFKKLKQKGISTWEEQA